MRDGLGGSIRARRLLFGRKLEQRCLWFRQCEQRRQQCRQQRRIERSGFVIGRIELRECLW